MKLSDMLTGYRRRKQLTRVDFAKRAGLSPSYLRSLETERGHGDKKPKPTFASVEKLAVAMHVPTKELIRELDAEERTRLGLPYEEPSILARAERELPPAQRTLLEQIALEFLQSAEAVRPPRREPVFTEIEEGLLRTRGVRRLSEIYAKSLNVFTDASFCNTAANKPSDRFTAAVVVTRASEPVGGLVYAARTGMGQKGAEEYAVWLGFLEALKYRREGEAVNLFTDRSSFPSLMEFLTVHSRNGDPQGELPENKTFKNCAYALATHLAGKAAEEGVRLHVWAVKAHLNPGLASGLQKQIDYFARQNGCELTRELAADLCAFNGMADAKAREYRKKMAEKKSARWAALPQDAFTPLTLTPDAWRRYHELSLLGQMTEETLPLFPPPEPEKETPAPEEVSPEEAPMPTPDEISHEKTPEPTPDKISPEETPTPTPGTISHEEPPAPTAKL